MMSRLRVWGAARVLEQYAADARPVEERHLLSNKFCGDTELRKQLVMFAEGAQRESLSDLFLEAVMPFAFIPVAERSCEGRHAIAKRELFFSHYIIVANKMFCRCQHHAYAIAFLFNNFIMLRAYLLCSMKKDVPQAI